ncbi:site-specific integrase [Acinetobacter baumannii]|nr:site-specific integrase [Acinetobacter baumannii]
MYVLKTIKLSKKKLNENKIILLFDTSTSAPCLYSFLFSLSILRFQSLSTQQADLIAVKIWYEYWYTKHCTTFCQSFLTSTYDPDIYLNEIDNFIFFLENYNDLKFNTMHYKSNQWFQKNYSTISQRMRSLFKFFTYLLDEFWNLRHQSYPFNEITNRRKRIDLFLNNKRKIFSKFNRYALTVNNGIIPNFKSLDDEMLTKLYEIIRPSRENKINPHNPFKSKTSQFRNFLLVHLMLNYGLRIGELMLISEKSIKKSINYDKYNLIITNTDDEFDSRSRKPHIKNAQSHRVIELSKQDYQLINIYINSIRKTSTTQILFTSFTPPYPALSYSTINAIFKKIDIKFRTLYPHYFDNEKLYGTLEKFTPHTCRHTWAYITLAFALEKHKKDLYNQSLNNNIMEKAQEDLRILGGWSMNSQMPKYYAKRFIVESSNIINLERISQELWEN